MTEYDLYNSGMSIPEVSNHTGIPRSTLRFRFNKVGVLRGRAEGVKIAAKNGKLGSGNRGKKREFTEEWKLNISKGKKGKGVGFSLKPSGYIEITMGEHKGRLEHVVLMESKIGRRLYSNECVHHIDHDKTNNDIENLLLMTKSEHAKLHASENLKNRERDKLGRFK